MAGRDQTNHTVTLHVRGCSNDNSTNSNNNDKPNLFLKLLLCLLLVSRLQITLHDARGREGLVFESAHVWGSGDFRSRFR